MRKDDGRKQRRLDYNEIVYPNLRNWFIRHDMALSKFAYLTEIHQNTMYDAMFGCRDIRKSTIDKILLATGMSYEEAFYAGK